MEGFFCGFTHFFTRKFDDRNGERYNFPQDSYKIGKEVTDFQRPAAYGPEIGTGPGQYGQDGINAHLPVAGGQGMVEKGRRHRQPEEEVQQGAQQRDAQTHPEDTEKVVQQPHQRPQRQRPQYGEGLPCDRDLHLSGRAGRTGRPFPARRPRRSGSQWPPPPSDPRRPG